MAGQSSGRSISSTLSDIHSICSHSGTMDDEGSKIGGEGRMGSDGDGRLEMAPSKDVTKLWGGRKGKATSGQTGYNSGSGKSL